MSKEYEMTYKLSARLGENFKGTFSSAQAVLSSAQKKIQDLNKAQSNITAYQKQQESISRTAQKLEVYKQQLENTQQGLEELRQSTKDTAEKEAELVVKEVEFKNRIESTELALSDKNQRLQQLAEKLKTAGVDTDKFAEESNRLKGEIDELAELEKEAAEEVEKFGNTGKLAFDTIASSLEAAGITAALGKIADAYKECVSVSMEFGGTMSTVEALSGASAYEMEELSAKAKQLGADTAFTANQAAEAMTYMGMAGWGAEDMMAGMDGVINLAAASGEDLALVSDIVTDNLTAFGLTAADTSHFVDVLAAAATSSNTNVSIMGETFKGSAAIAGALGYSIEDVAVAVGMMANAGVKGSVAGTALKNTFNGLLNGATLTSEAFGEVEYSAVNADGTIDSFSESINELRGYFEQMSDAERVQNAMAIAGQRGYNGLLAIINATDADYQSLTESINSCTGAAQKMAEIKLDNLQGDVTLLDSAADGLRMTVGGLYEDELRALVQVGTDILTGINEFCESHPIVTKVIMGTVGAASLLVSGYLKLVFVKKAYTALQKLGIIRTKEETVAKDEETVAEGANTAATGANTAAKIANAAAIANVAIVAAAVVAEFVYFADVIWGVSDAVKDVQNSTQSIIDTMNQSISANDAETNILQTKVAVYDELRQKENRTAAEEKQLSELANELQDILGDNVAVVNSLTGEYNDLSNAVNNYVETTTQKVKMSALEDAAKDAYAQIAEIERAMEVRSQEYSDSKNHWYSFYTNSIEQWTWMKDMQAYHEEIAKLQDVIGDYEDALRSETETSAENAELLSAIIPSAYDIVADTIANTTSRIEEQVQVYNDAYQAAYDSVSGQYALWDEAAETLPMSIQTITGALESQYEYWDNYNYNLQSLSKRTDDIEGLGAVIASYADGSEESVNAIAGMAEATDEELAAMVAHYKEQQRIQEEVAATLSEYQTDIVGEMDDLVDSVESAVEEMNLSDTAAAAAKSTIQAYADAILENKGSVIEAADIIAMATASALSGIETSDSYYAEHDYSKVASHAYASGTNNAASGIALVGEEGPELMVMRGGEKIYNAADTQALLSSGAGTQITISPQFVINGNATEDNLQEMSERLVEMLKDALEEAGIDKRRSAYA